MSTKRMIVVTMAVLALGAGVGMAGKKGSLQRPLGGKLGAAKTAAGKLGAGSRPAAPRRRFIAICRPDAQKLCQGVTPGDRRIATCLAEHQQELQPSCLRALQRARRVSATRKDCAADVSALCKEVIPGGGRILTCLRQNQDKVSAACKARFQKADQPAETADVAAVLDEAASEQVSDPAAEPIDQSVPIAEEAPVETPPVESPPAESPPAGQ